MTIEKIMLFRLFHIARIPGSVHYETEEFSTIHKVLAYNKLKIKLYISVRFYTKNNLLNEL